MTIYTFNEDAHRVVGKSALAFEKRPINAVPPKRERKNIAKGGATQGSYVAPAIIKSGGNGIYTVDILDDAGNTLESNVTAIATRATAYDLPAENSIADRKSVV